MRRNSSEGVKGRLLGSWKAKPRRMYTSAIRFGKNIFEKCRRTLVLRVLIGEWRVLDPGASGGVLLPKCLASDVHYTLGAIFLCVLKPLFGIPGKEILEPCN